MQVEREVTNGRVDCPLAGNVDVERCLHCNWSAQVSLRGSQKRVICSPRVPDEQILSHRGVRMPLP